MNPSLVDPVFDRLEDHVDAVGDVVDDDVGVGQVLLVADAAQHAHRQAQLGLLAHEGVGGRVAHHYGVRRPNAELPAINRVRVDWVWNIPLNHNLISILLRCRLEIQIFGNFFGLVDT